MPTTTTVRRAGELGHTAMALLGFDLVDAGNAGSATYGKCVPWADLEPSQRHDVVEAARCAMTIPGDCAGVAEAVHIKWVERMRDYGWSYGVLSYVDSTHPAMCSFEALSDARRRALVLFVEVVRAYHRAVHVQPEE